MSRSDTLNILLPSFILLSTSFFITPASAQIDDFLTFSQSPAGTNTTQQTILVAGICVGATVGATIIFCVLAHFGPRMLGHKKLDQLAQEDREPWFAARGINDEKPLNAEYLERERQREKEERKVKRGPTVSEKGKLTKSQRRKKENEERQWRKEGEMV